MCAIAARIKTEKSGFTVTVTLPILPILATTIAPGPCGDLTFTTGESGRPLTKESFGNEFRKACHAAGVPGSAHCVRKIANIDLIGVANGWECAHARISRKNCATRPAPSNTLGHLSLSLLWPCSSLICSNLPHQRASRLAPPGLGLDPTIATA
jgi:hypothetical protein